jgi:YggT family protein
MELQSRSLWVRTIVPSVGWPAASGAIQSHTHVFPSSPNSGGFGNFLSIYNLLISARILLSWFPQAQSIGVLSPLFSVTDPFLNLFRGVIPPLFGLDFSPILAFFLLNLLTNATAAVGCEIPASLQKQQPFSTSSTSSRHRTLSKLLRVRINDQKHQLTMNYE